MTIGLLRAQTLLKLAENVIAHPEDPKYQKFKPTNTTIKRLLVEPRGTLEYAVAVSGPRLASVNAHLYHDRLGLHHMCVEATAIVGGRATDLFGRGAGGQLPAILCVQ